MDFPGGFSSFVMWTALLQDEEEDSMQEEEEVEEDEEGGGEGHQGGGGGGGWLETWTDEDSDALGDDAAAAATFPAAEEEGGLSLAPFRLSHRMTQGALDGYARGRYDGSKNNGQGWALAASISRYNTAVDNSQYTGLQQYTVLD